MQGHNVGQHPSGHFEAHRYRRRVRREGQDFDNHLLSTKDVSCFSRLIDGQYYAYEQVIPRKFVSTVKVPSEDLLRAASRAAIVASEEDRAMRVIVDKDTGTITVKAVLLTAAAWKRICRR